MTRYPELRLRRLRNHPGIRRMVRETSLSADAFIYPIFVRAGSGPARPVSSMPGVNQWSVEGLGEEARKVRDEGIPAVILFGLPEAKDAIGSASWREDGVVQRALEAVRRAAPELVRVVDVCFCEYTEHGHCGVMQDGQLDNDATLKNLGKQAQSLARAGADVIAPSGMIDGMVGGIRGALDQAGFNELPILSYAAKFASGFYGPFREAADSTPAFGDRRSHQMDPANADEALREVAVDLEEGADIVMVKPALPYLDVIHRVKERFGVPTAAYQVSGEYSMIKAAGEKGWIDENRVMMETLVAIRRAGADMILSYFARDAAKLLRSGWSL
ncbi:MAG TPA: porphobilinogen synthase [Candidatus Eisenbacteria bacterium]|nr:porphobilinogen synthase [Candidatus Eisenbacteria bacterium]